MDNPAVTVIARSTLECAECEWGPQIECDGSGIGHGPIDVTILATIIEELAVWNGRLKFFEE